MRGSASACIARERAGAASRKSPRHGRLSLTASMAAEDSTDRPDPEQVVVDVQDSRELGPVEAEAHSAQVTLKSAVQGMREATLEEAFALDFRVRMVLREPPPPAGTFDNPWSYNYLCDALGIVCRELWPNDGLWRTIMQRVVVGITPHVAALHRELNVLLQD